MTALSRFEDEDFSAMESQWWEDARMVAPPSWPEPGPFEGRDAIKEQFQRLASDMGTHRFRETEVAYEDDEWVVVSFIWDVSGAGSGAPIASKMAGAYQIVEGRIKSACFGWTPQEVMAATGLSG